MKVKIIITVLVSYIDLEKYEKTDCYEGYFERGLKSGYGILENSRTTYYGYFVNDQLEGYAEKDDKFET